VFALNLISATHAGLLKLRQAANVDKRPFIIARGGFTGVHRYAANWTGDSASDWNFLAIGLPICRPMFLTDRQDPNVYQRQVLNTQFMLGNDLLNWSIV
jgi:alpha-glucosidase (family GH31 glycosyl hydrolase)